MEARLVIVTPGGLSKEVRAKGVADALARLPRGMAAVILRDPTLAQAETIAHRQALEKVCHAAAAPLFVHRDLGPTAQDNWHLPDRPESLADASRAPRLISRSTHSAETAIALSDDVDLVLIGPIWPTPEKPEGLGCSALTAASAGMRGCRARLFAIGGVTSESRARRALEAGADGVAGIRSFAGTQISEIARAFQT